MDELDRSILLGLGYQVTEYGAILDNSGNYLQSVEIDGKTIESWQDKEDYDALQIRKQKLQDIGFKPDEASSNNIETQEEIAIARHHITEYEQDSLNVNKPNYSDVYYAAAVEEIKSEKQFKKDSLQNLVKEKKILEEQSKQKSIENFTTISLVLLIALLIVLLVKYFRKHKAFLYYSVITVSSLILSIYLGFKNKILTNEYYLRKASLKKSEWQKDAYLEYVKSQDSFFQLNVHRFNWEWFLLTMLAVILLAFLIRNTIYYDKIKSFLNNIKR